MRIKSNLKFDVRIISIIWIGLIFSAFSLERSSNHGDDGGGRERILLNEGWRFYKYDSSLNADSLIYDVRPEVFDTRDDKPADAQPTEAEKMETKRLVLKPWILPTGNAFLKDSKKKYARPQGDPGRDFPFVKPDFDDSSWEKVNLPHDWAIKGPFYEGWEAEVGGGMGRLPSPGVAWYRKKLFIPASDSVKSIFLDVDGAMSYAMVWLNGHLVGGWPYGYASWRVDLTPYVVPGVENQLAIRLDNPPNSSRWYPGGGIYRNVWLVKTHPVHIEQWGTFITTRDVSSSSATIDLEVSIRNDSKKNSKIKVVTDVFLLDAKDNKNEQPVSSLHPFEVMVRAGENVTTHHVIKLKDPLLWGPAPTQEPHRYIASTVLIENNRVIDRYTTPFGIRSITSDSEKGIFVNGERIFIKGVNLHHDLGAVGSAFNVRAAERQLEILREMGCNAIRTAHNPPAPELLELTDRMGFIVMDEIFDCWELKKTPLDFHLIFPDWHEQDLCAMIRRDRNHPSVFMWSFGNEVGEQYTGEEGAEVAKELHDIAKEEDPTRPATASMNFAKPDMPFPRCLDVISLNYQGEGIRDDSAYAGLKGITTPPQFSAFHNAFPDKVILSSENAATVSSRGTYLFPVFEGISAPVKDGQGGNPLIRQVSTYELYTMEFGSSPDKVFASEDRNPFVAGGFVWSGWDYLGEPTPYYLSRSSYCGIIDLPGFKKDRFYLYQSRWRPDLPMAHILPHWTWPERVGQITPVHVFTSGDEAELFLNAKSLGRKKKRPYEYRLRWDDVKYMPGELKVIAYKDGKKWAEDSVKTAGKAYRLECDADRSEIKADGNDLSFVTVRITDKEGQLVPTANHLLRFTIEGPGEIIATDNGDATDMTPFPATERKAFNGLCLVIVRSKVGESGKIKVNIISDELEKTTVYIICK